MQNFKDKKGFTLIELLLVVVIIGILLAVIVPRAWRANVDSKYGLVRQNATELASFASQWAEQMMEAQDLEGSEARLVHYYHSLTVSGGGSESIDTDYTRFIAAEGDNNWRNDQTLRLLSADRLIGGGSNVAPEAAVEDLVPPERLQRNPFSGSSVFRDVPDGIVIPGALACGVADDQGYKYYALVFQGTDSSAGTVGTGSDLSDAQLHAGMGPSLAGLRNGIFMARLAPN